MDEAARKHFAELRAHVKAYEKRHAGSRPANPDLPPMGSVAEDFPEQHRKIGKLDGNKVAEVSVEPKNGGEPWVEKWRGISRRHALGEARAHYRGEALVYFADGEPY